MTEPISACCRAKIMAYIPHASFYSLSPRDPVPYCTACGQHDPEEIDEEEEEDARR